MFQVIKRVPYSAERVTSRLVCLMGPIECNVRVDLFDGLSYRLLLITQGWHCWRTVSKQCNMSVPTSSWV